MHDKADKQPRGQAGRTLGTGRRGEAPAKTDPAEPAASEFEAPVAILEDLFPIALAYVHKRGDARTLVAEAAKEVVGVVGDRPELNRSRKDALAHAIRIGGTRCVIKRAYERYYDCWLSYASRFFPSGASDLAVDVVHDAFVDLWSSRKVDFSSASAVNEWMRKRIHGVAVEALGVRNCEVGLDEEAEPALSFRAPGPSPQRHAMRAERAMRLRQILQEAMPEEREAYVLRYLAQPPLTVTAIAEKQGVSRQTVWARIRSVLSKMESRFDV
jgi:RNA polymerase sigma factor (sigma-70 family)